MVTSMRTMSDHRLVTTVCPGNYNCCSRSTSSCHSLADVRMPANVFLAGVGCSLALTKAIVFLEDWNHFIHTSPVLMALVVVLRIWSCLKQYHPSLSVPVQQLRKCFRVPHLKHNMHFSVSAMLPVCRFYGLGSTSYTACLRNLMRWGSSFHSSALVTFLLTAFSYIVQAPCCFYPALHVLISSHCSFHLLNTFPLVFVWGIEKEPSPALP